MSRRGEKRNAPRRTGPTRLNDIQPDIPGPMAAVIHAARRWRELAGEELSRRLPLLDVRDGAWVIGMPSPAWEAELARLRQSLVAAGKKIPPLAGRVLAPGSRPSTAAGQRPQAAPPVNADAGERLRWIMEQMCGESDS
jgi:hypothetical protein